MIKLLHTLILLAFSAPSAAMSIEQAIPIFIQSEETSSADIDHSQWQEFLSETIVTTHPSGVNRLDYSVLTPKQISSLENYLIRMRSIDPRQYSRSAQFAYWVNLYNALTVKLVIDYYPINSIRQIKSGLFSVGPWGKKIQHVAGVDLSLDDIEHKILRPIWQDPRIHYAVNCASIGCPNLLAQAFTAANTEKLLNLAARQYINHPRGVTIDNGKLHISSIYHWYKEDFGGDIDGIIDHLSQYAEPSLFELLNQDFYRYDHAYDWDLNRP